MSEANRGIFLHQKGVNTKRRNFPESELGFAIGQSIKDEKGQEAFDEFNNKYSNIII